MMCNGVIVMGSAIVMQTNSVMSGGHAEVGGYVVAAIDDFVLGVVLLVFGLGMYELFISEIDEEAMGNGADLSLGKRPEWLQTKGLDDLKKKLAKVIIMSLLVKTLGFFEVSLYSKTAKSRVRLPMFVAPLGTWVSSLPQILIPASGILNVSRNDVLRSDPKLPSCCRA